MFKALLATAAVTICCMGNKYPAKACVYGCGQERYESPVVEGYDVHQRLQRMEQEMDYQRSQQQQQRNYFGSSY